jgi:lysophospholipase L1-like esterase
MSWAKRAGELSVILLLSTIVFILVGEIFLRVYLARNIFYDVEMARYADTLKIDAENPLIGHVHRPKGSAELMGVNVEISSAGFRDSEYPLDKGDSWRIIALGDSLTFGWGVEKEESFEYLLERALTQSAPTEIINFAAGNYNTVQQVNLFLDQGLAYAPDHVVLFYFINDAEPVPVASGLAWLGRSRLATFVWSRVKALAASRDPSVGFESFYSNLYRVDAEGWREAKKALAQLRDVCREKKINFQVVILPELHELVDYTFANEHKLIVDYLGSLEVPVLDLAPQFANEVDPIDLWVAADDAHPNAKAHQLIFGYALPFINQGIHE